MPRLERGERKDAIRAAEMSNTHRHSFTEFTFVQFRKCQLRFSDKSPTPKIYKMPNHNSNGFREKNETHFTRLWCCFVADFCFVLVLSGTITAADECCDSTEIASISIVR